MPRGQADFGLYTQTPVAAGLADPGEAAARLGGINIYDRRGWTVWMDDFEAPVVRWTASDDGFGTDPILSTTEAWMGTQSVYFVTRNTNVAFARLERRFPLVRLGRIGIEFFILLAGKTPGYFEASLRLYDGSNISDARLHLDSEAQTATIVTPDGGIEVATYCFNAAIGITWMPVKLVVDMDTDRYVRLLIGPQEIDLSTHLLVPGVVTTDKYFRMRLSLEGDVAGDMTAYLDNFILTQNEP